MVTDLVGRLWKIRFVAATEFRLEFVCSTVRIFFRITTLIYAFEQPNV